MKIYGDKIASGYSSEKTEVSARISKDTKSDSEKTAQVALSGDELELTSKKAAVLNSVREANLDSATSVEFDVSQVPVMKQRLGIISNYMLSNPAEALSTQANLASETVARLIG
jgi:hypothetical protein